MFLLQGNSILYLEFLVFTGWVMFWNVSRVYFFFFNIQNIKSNCRIIFLKRFPVVYFWWIFYSISIIFIDKRFNFWYSLRISFDCFMIWCNTVNVDQLHYSDLLIFFFFVQAGESIYVPPRLKFILWHL